MTDNPMGQHRCFGAIAVRHGLVASIAALPVPVAARAASVVVAEGPQQLNPGLLHVNPVQTALAVALVAAGVTVWALLDHVAEHWFAQAAADSPADDVAGTDQHGQVVEPQS